MARVFARLESDRTSVGNICKERLRESETVYLCRVPNKIYSNSMGQYRDYSAARFISIEAKAFFEVGER